MKRVLTAAALAGAALMFVSPAAQAADREFCRTYTDAALRQVHEVMEMPRCVARIEPGPRWSTERHVHFDWCRGVSRDAANDEREARRDFIERCRRW